MCIRDSHTIDFLLQFTALGELQHIIISILYRNLHHLASSFPLSLLCFRKPAQTITRFYVRLTIDSQSPHNCFPIVSRFSRVPGGFILGTNSQPKLDSTSDSQSTHNRLTIVWSMFGVDVEWVLGSPLKFLSAIHKLLYANLVVPLMESKQFKHVFLSLIHISEPTRPY